MNLEHYCSCCLSEGCYKDMCREYYNEGKQEIYNEILLNTFNIELSNKISNSCMICEHCIRKLQAAASFKEQVLKCQDVIIKKFMDSKRDLQLKIEVDSADEYDDDILSTFKDSDIVSHFTNDKGKGQLSVLKLESIDDQKITPRKNELILKTQPNATKTLPNIIDNCEKSHIFGDLLTNNMKNSNCKIMLKKTLKKTCDTKKSKKGGRDIGCTSITQTQINSRENTLKLIQNSNLCLFRSLKTKFGCIMCKMAFVDVSKLREHSLTHTNITLLAYRVNKLRGLSFKNADISQLKCKKCSQEIPDLTELMSHLKNNHNLSFKGTNHFLIPYKLIDKNQCALCDMKYNSFLRLSIHMNSHYRNNVCDVCGLSFINRISLRTHVQSMHKEKKCSLCPAKFLTVTSKVKHLKKVHNYYNSKRHCNLCDKTFRYTYMLDNHKIEEHGTKKTVVNCNECDKTFFNEANLRIHVRSVHIKERNYQCEICGTRFFTKADQKRHERTHNDVRSFCCTYCESKFKSNDSRRRHMKRQHGHVFS